MEKIIKKLGSFENNLEDIDGIIDSLESGQLTLDESIKEYEKAMKLLKKSSDLLNKAQGKIIKVTKDFNEELVLEEV
ncbi:MAG: exodeoxyribonuclease VII small subunit [Fusobacteriaceae bacterium]